MQRKCYSEKTRGLCLRVTTQQPTLSDKTRTIEGKIDGTFYSLTGSDDASIRRPFVGQPLPLSHSHNTDCYEEICMLDGAATVVEYRTPFSGTIRKEKAKLPWQPHIAT
jgi:hypothetical protein